MSLSRFADLSNKGKIMRTRLVLFIVTICCAGMLMACNDIQAEIEAAVDGTLAAQTPVVEFVEQTVIIQEEVTVEVTSIVEKEVTVEVTREVEVTRIEEVEVVVTATATKTPAPTATPTPRPTATPAPAAPSAESDSAPETVNNSSLLDIMTVTRGLFQDFGGHIDNAVNTGYVDCGFIISVYEAIAASPTLDTTSMSAAEQGAHGAYRQAVAVFVDGARDITGNCRDFLTTQDPGSIPFQQWGLARQRVSDAIDIIQPAILSLGGE